jgi:L-aspartate oxidase
MNKVVLEMKRIVLDNTDNSTRIKTDVVIIGCGVAGLYAALNLNPKIRCLLLNKSGIKHSNSMYAQGGIAAVIEPYVNGDNPKLHIEDTLVAGAGLCDKTAVNVLVKEAWKNIQKIVSYDVPFDKNGDEFLLTREGGHCKNRILHCGGDATGLHLTETLYEQVLKRKNITVMENVFFTDIIVKDNKAYGIMILDENEKPALITASKVVIASGGVGRVFRNSTNAICASGDGIAAARRANAKLADMEFIQFHPTALIHPSETGRFFLISEALRGEGGVLRNRRWETFMQNVHLLADLAPRDIVTRAIITEMKKNDIPNVYLDITTKSRSFLSARFPTIYQECMKRGIDIAKNWIPVMPVQHYFMGGIKTDINAATSIENLYACGEVARTGVHGANRLASNSLLECLVFAGRCSDQINQIYENKELHSSTEKIFKGAIEATFYTGATVKSSKSTIEGINILNDSNVNTPAGKTLNKSIDAKTNGRNNSNSVGTSGENLNEYDLIDFDSYSSEIRFLTTQKCGIIRNEIELKEAKTRMSEIIEILNNTLIYNKKGVETYNQAIVAMEIIKAAIKRKKSVGAHFRSDDINLTGK